MYLEYWKYVRLQKVNHVVHIVNLHTILISNLIEGSSIMINESHTYKSIYFYPLLYWGKIEIYLGPC